MTGCWTSIKPGWSPDNMLMIDSRCLIWAALQNPQRMLVCSAVIILPDQAQGVHKGLAELDFGALVVQILD